MVGQSRTAGNRLSGYAYDLRTGIRTDLGSRFLIARLISGDTVVGADSLLSSSFNLTTHATTVIGSGRGVTEVKQIAHNLMVGDNFAPKSPLRGRRALGREDHPRSDRWSACPHSRATRLPYWSARATDPPRRRLAQRTTEPAALTPVPALHVPGCRSASAGTASRASALLDRAGASGACHRHSGCDGECAEADSELRVNTRRSS